METESEIGHYIEKRKVSRLSKFSPHKKSYLQGNHLPKDKHYCQNGNFPHQLLQEKNISAFNFTNSKQMRTW